MSLGHGADDNLGTGERMDIPAQPTAKPQRGWRRGLLMTGIVLVIAWVLHDRDRSARTTPRPAPAAPLAAPTPLPADASLSMPSQARPRLLALLPRRPDPSVAAVAARLRQVCTDRLALVEGDEQVAKELGIETLPAFILYSATGRELKRLSGPDAFVLLAAELRAMGLATTGLAGEGTP